MGYLGLHVLLLVHVLGSEGGDVCLEATEHIMLLVHILGSEGGNVCLEATEHISHVLQQ